MISIIIPVYNVERYLTRCLDSIVAQTYGSFEVLLIDDGSRDQSGKICEQYTQDKRFHVFHQANQGVSAARNKGLTLSTGEYVLFVDADDWLAPDMLKKLMSGIKDADLAMCFHYVAKEKRSGGLSFHDNWPHARSAPYEVADVYYDIFAKSATLWNKLMKREVIDGLFFETGMTYGEDSVFLSECFKKVKKAVIVPECLYFYHASRKGNVVSSVIDKRSFELLENTKVIFRNCKANHHSAVGIKRILISVREVQGKIAPSFSDIHQKRKYIRACNALLKYPSCRDYLDFFRDNKIPKSDKKDAVLFRLGLIYRYFLAIKAKILH